ncbi:MAG: CoA transferase, partial [Chloroflexota bacterium]
MAPRVAMMRNSEAARGALSNMRVLDLTHAIAGPYCTKLLADYGADVVKVERPGTGDMARRFGPFPGDRPDPERSGLFLYLNTNKKSVTLDLKSVEGRALALRLAAKAD